MNAIPCISIGRTEVRITRVGFGCARLFGGVESAAAARLVEAALECGIRHFDTAPSYGDGRSEEVLGAVLRGVEGVTVATKVGIPRPISVGSSWKGRWYRRYLRPSFARVPILKRGALAWTEWVRTRRPPNITATGVRRYLEPSSVERELETSLTLLGRPAIDLYLIHEPEQFIVDDKLIAAVDRLRSQGLIRAFGLAFGGVASQCLKHLDVVQGLYMPNHVIDVRRKTVDNAPTRIFHGVMRSEQISAPSSLKLKGPDALVHALRLEPNAGVVFSASTPRQIRDVIAAVRLAVSA